jgi:hypothetical protein
MISPQNFGDMIMRLSRQAIVLGVAAIAAALLGLSLMVGQPAAAVQSDDNQGVLNSSIGI